MLSSAPSIQMHPNTNPIEIASLHPRHSQTKWNTEAVAPELMNNMFFVRLVVGTWESFFVTSSTNKKDEGHIFSINRKLSDKSSIYFQNAKSDMKIDDGEQRSFGYTYKINDETKIFIHQSSRESSNKGKVDYISVGTEYKF